MYIEIMVNPEKIDKLYQNINVKFEFIKGNINESQYKKKMEKHRKNIDKLLAKLNEGNITCDELSKLVFMKI